MTWNCMLAGAAFAVAGSLTSAAYAGAEDYAFEAVNARIKTSNVASFAVRLIHKATRKPVTNAVIVQTRIDMAPDGMAKMASPIDPQRSPRPGVFAFKAPLTMAGRWLLTISAKVPGEPEPVAGKITFRAAQ
jgi:hypothetical protein